MVRKVAVEFFCIDGRPQSSDAEFFVRQKYCTSEEDIHVASLHPKDLSPDTPCPCSEMSMQPGVHLGDWVLVIEGDRLQPFEFQEYAGNRAWVRRMKRRREWEGVGKINELIWTEEIIDVSVRRVIRKCHVVEVHDGAAIPRLADWGGSSDWFFYRRRKDENQVNTGGCIDDEDSQSATTQEDCPPGLPAASEDALNGIPRPITNAAVQGPRHPEKASSDFPEEGKLRGLDLFCGGGNFGRGVADGGVVHHKWYCIIEIALMIGPLILI